MFERFPIVRAAHGNERFDVPVLHPDRLDLPLRRKKPARIGVCFTGDLFDPAVPDTFRGQVLDKISQAPQHEFFMLTKRAREMHDFFSWARVLWANSPLRPDKAFPENLYLGVSVTTQADADERIPLLLQTPAARRWVSVEPMLGPVNISPWLNPRHWAHGLDWAVCGSIDHPSARYPAPKREWIDSLVEQCKSAGVPVWVKNNAQGLHPGTIMDGRKVVKAAWPQEGA